MATPAAEERTPAPVPPPAPPPAPVSVPDADTSPATAMEAESIALAWRLQQEEQQAFLGAMEASTPNPPSRRGVSGTGVGGSGGSASTGGADEGMDLEDDDASLQVGCHATHT